MILSAAKLCEEIRRGNESQPDGIAVIPVPDLETIERSGEASISLRLGRWFVTMRQSSVKQLVKLKYLRDTLCRLEKSLSCTLVDLFYQVHLSGLSCQQITLPMS